MKTFLELIKREFKLFWKNDVLKMLFFGAPLLYGILIGFVYSKGKVTDLPIIVVDEDQSSMSAKVIEMMQDNEILDITLLQFDQSNIDRLMIQKEAACVVMIPKNFEKEVLTKKYPEITTIVNTANVLTANYASGAVQVVLGTFKAGTQIETLRKQGVPEQLLMSQYEPFKTTFIKKHNRSTNYMYFLLPGVLFTVLQQVLLLGLALSFASEFENQTFISLVRKSKNTFNLIAVKIIPYLIMSVIVWLMYWGFSKMFHFPLMNNLGALTFIAGIFVIAVCFIGILVSIVIPNQLKATEVLMVVATPSFMISGFTWPLSQMPEWVQFFSNMIPLTHFLQVYRILIVEGGTFDLTYKYILSLLLIAFVCAVLSYIALKIKVNKANKVIEAEESSHLNSDVIEDEWIEDNFQEK